MLQTVKTKLRKHTRLFRLAGRQRKVKSEILIVQSANRTGSSNPFEWIDEHDEQDDVDETRALLSAKQRLLDRLHPYCYSTDPLSPHRTTLPELSEYTVSIMTRSTEVNNSQKRRIVNVHLLSESVPKALLTRHCWTQSNVDIGMASRSSTRSVYRRINGGFQSLVARGKLRSKRLSASDMNLSAPRRAAGATDNYCPTGVVYSRVTVMRPPQEETLLRRWRAWTRQHLRRNRRVAVADDDGAAGVP